MYKKCPKCGFQQTDPRQADVCERCGLVFEKWLKSNYQSRSSQRVTRSLTKSYSLLNKIKPWLFTIPEPYPKSRFYLNVVIYIGFFIWGWSFIFANHYSVAQRLRRKRLKAMGLEFD